MLPTDANHIAVPAFFGIPVSPCENNGIFSRYRFLETCFGRLDANIGMEQLVEIDVFFCEGDG